MANSLAAENCLWYDECTNIAMKGKNCPPDPPHGPKLLEDEEAKKILKNYCPEFFNAEGKDKFSCLRLI